jgi:hypothetical protein
LAGVLPLWQRLGNRGAVARILECFGFCARAEAKDAPEGPDRAALLERMACLWGAAGALRELSGTPMTPDEREEYEAEVAAGRSELPPAAWDAAWSAGRSLDMEAAIAYALAG